MPVDALSRYRDLAPIEVPRGGGGAIRALPLRRPPMPAPTSAKRRRYVDYEPVDLIARQAYGNEFLYWSILELNGVDFADDLTPGQTLFVAPLEQVTRVRRG